ncbi:MAG: VIT1/CCC1 transporter family protein, partial [Candidatus Limnocylindria bacterium]
GSPWVAGGTSFALFATGAAIPLVPFLFTRGIGAVVASGVLAAVVLFLTGAAITIITGQSATRSGLRQVAFGLVAAAITFGAGRLLGTAIS